MAAQVLTPDYSMLAKAPQPGIGTAISSGLQAYGQISKIQRARAATQLAQQQEARQEKQAALDAQVKTLQIHTAKRDIMQNRFADLAQTPDDQKESEYQKIKSEAQQFGLNHDSLPDHYNDEIATEANTAYQKSTQAAEARKNENAVHIQNLKNAGAIQVAQQKAQTAQAKAQAAPDAFSKEQQVGFAKYTTQLATDSQVEQDHVQPLYQELRAQIKKVETDPISGHILWAKKEGQRLQQLLVLAQGDAIKQFHLGRMTQYEFNIIRQGVGKGTMYGSVLDKVFADRLKVSDKLIRKNKFAQDYIKGGGSRSNTDFAAKWSKNESDRKQADLEYTASQNFPNLPKAQGIAKVKQQLGIQ